MLAEPITLEGRVYIDELRIQHNEKGSMESKINLAEKLAQFSDQWAPRVAAQLNDYDIMVVKVRGEFVWRWCRWFCRPCPIPPESMFYCKRPSAP